jgi:hypothetical protein
VGSKRRRKASMLIVLAGIWIVSFVAICTVAWFELARK